MDSFYQMVTLIAPIKTNGSQTNPKVLKKFGNKISRRIGAVDKDRGGGGVLSDDRREQSKCMIYRYKTVKEHM